MITFVRRVLIISMSFMSKFTPLRSRWISELLLLKAWLSAIALSWLFVTPILLNEKSKI